MFYKQEQGRLAVMPDDLFLVFSAKWADVATDPGESLPTWPAGLDADVQHLPPPSASRHFWRNLHHIITPALVSPNGKAIHTPTSPMPSVNPHR